MKFLRTPRSALVGILALAPFAAPAFAANLISNGDFDNIGSVWVDNTYYGSDDLQTPGGTNIPDWTNVPNFVNEFWVNVNNLYGVSPSPGNGSAYFVDLTGQANNKPYGGIEQTIATTPGSVYQLTFDLGSSTNYNGSGLAAAAYTASVTGNSLLASQLYVHVPTTTNEWTSESLTFTADSSTATLEFLGDSDYTSRYTGLDNVSIVFVSAGTPPVTGVAEPSTWAMLLVGLFGIGAITRARLGQKRGASRA